ncbi:MAG: PAS domain S-box protein, partial [Deltaproteobacteria bacterium]|nr:PAS domain S-box protein [Deltaproteobacteria bacterium]
QPQGISPIKVIKWTAVAGGLLFAILTGMVIWSWSLRKNIRSSTERLSRELIERRHIQDALEESEERYRSLFNGMPVGLYRTTPSGEIMDANPALIEMYGYRDREDLLSMNSRDLYLDEKDRDQFMSAMEQDGIVRGFEVRMKRHDGTIRWIRNSGRVVRDDGGAVLFYEGSVEDITEHRHVREALEKEIAFSTTLIQDSPTYYVAIDAQGKTIMMNHTLLKALGYSMDEVTGADYLNTFVPESEREMLSGVFEKIVRMREPTVNENQILTKDGRQFLVEWHGRPVFKTNGELDYFFGVGIDITQRKQAQEERQRLENRLQQSYKMEALGTLAGGIAHDFNNILSSVLGFTELAKIKLAKGKDIEKELDEVLKAGARARDLVKQILTFSRQSGIQKSPIEITSMIKETLKFLRASLPTTIEIKQNLPSYETTVMADPTQIHQVIMNLCTNAAYAMKEKGGIIDIKVAEKELTDKAELEYKGLAPGRYLQLSIADTGSGIPGEIIDRIFDPFFTTKERGEGTGMGLSVVHGIIHDLGGAISVYSEPDKGTAFHLLFPRYIGERFEPFSPHSIVTMGKGRILFVDDEEGVIASGKEILENIGYTITPTTSASEALEIFRSGPDAFDLILTDMTMPKMTGIELSRQMLAIRPDIPIVLCTGSDIGVTPDIIRAAGIREMVMKPMTTNELAEAVYNALKTVNG